MDNYIYINCVLKINGFIHPWTEWVAHINKSFMNRLRHTMSLYFLQNTAAQASVQFVDVLIEITWV